MGKHLDWVNHPAMELQVAERELLMMVYRDWKDGSQFVGRHRAEAGMIAAGYVRIEGDECKITAKGIKFWEGFISARGDGLPYSVFKTRSGHKG